MATDHHKESMRYIYGKDIYSTSGKGEEADGRPSQTKTEEETQVRQEETNEINRNVLRSQHE
jgi:hypothetical protein